MSSTPWRLLPLAAGSAAWNMSVDEALLEAAPAHGPTLRLYSWERAAVSLGYRQREPDWLERAHALDLDVVRRSSGGGTVVHAGDLTYSVVAPLSGAGLPPGLSASFCWIREALLEGLRGQGLDAAPTAAVPDADRSPICFSAATGTEIELDRRKLVGSAQRRTRWGLLQHGSIRLQDDRQWYRALLGSDPGRPPGAGLHADEVAKGIVCAFERAVGARFDVAGLSAVEHERAHVRALQRAEQTLAAPRLRLSRTGISADSLP